MRNARDLRSTLMDGALSLAQGDTQAFLCLLFKSGFSSWRLAKELERFQAIVREDIGRRLHVLALQSPLDLVPTHPALLHIEDLTELQARVAEVLTDKPKIATRETVVGVLLHRWINRMPPVKGYELAAESGASTPTVTAALKTLEPSALRRDEDGLSLVGFTPYAWQKWLTLSTDGPTVKFVDRSGAPRSPEKLARQLAKLGRKDVAIGGVLGAKHHFPGLDITGAPQLDLVVHGTQHADLSFIEQLDPGLVRDDSQDQRGHVVVHFANRPNSLFKDEDGFVWADVLDCLVNLWASEQIHLVENLINHVAPGGLRGPIGD